MVSDTTKTLVQQSDLNTNGVLDHPNEVDHLERAIGSRIATMSPSNKMEVSKTFTQQFMPKRDADGLSEKPIGTLDGVGISPQALQRVVNAVRDGVKPEIDSYGTEAAPVKQHVVSEALVPERTPKGSDVPQKGHLSIQALR